MTKLKRTGICNRCGDCCRYYVITIPVPRNENIRNHEEKLRWYGFHEGFDARVKVTPLGKAIRLIIPSKCKHLIENQDGTTSCDIFPNRPEEICKEFPHNPEELADFPRCSYRFEEE